MLNLPKINNNRTIGPDLNSNLRRYRVNLEEYYLKNQNSSDKTCNIIQAIKHVILSSMLRVKKQGMCKHHGMIRGFHLV